jgi:hypothetical protein
MKRICAIVITVLIGCLSWSAPARAGLSELLSKAVEGSPFKIIHVADLSAMMAKPDSKVMVFDANPADIRESDGIIRGARLLSSSGSYDVAAELPPDKDTPLVFYCYNTH